MIAVGRGDGRSEDQWARVGCRRGGTLQEPTP